MTVELLLFAVFCGLLLFQIFNIINTKREYENEKGKIIEVKAKIVKCEMVELKKVEDEEDKEEGRTLNLKELQYGYFEYEVEGKKYSCKKMLPTIGIGMYTPGSEQDIVVLKEHPEIVMLERYDRKLKNDMRKNIVFFVLTLLFVLLLGGMVFTGMTNAVGMEDRIAF